MGKSKISSFFTQTDLCFRPFFYSLTHKPGRVQSTVVTQTVYFLFREDPWTRTAEIFWNLWDIFDNFRRHLRKSVDIGSTVGNTLKSWHSRRKISMLPWIFKSTPYKFKWMVLHLGGRGREGGVTGGSNFPLSFPLIPVPAPLLLASVFVCSVCALHLYAMF